MAEQETKRIKRLHVESLFGLYTHTVDLKLTDRVTIIHGPNGVGKTVLLKLISAIGSGNWAYVMRTPFSRLEIHFEDLSRLEVSRHDGLGVEGQLFDDAPQRDSASKDNTIKVSYFVNNQSTFVKELSAQQFLESKQAYIIAKEIPYIRQIQDDLWIDIRDDEPLDAEEVIDRFYRRISPSKRKTLLIDMPEELKNLRIGIHFIETNRLLKKKSRRSSRENSAYTSSVSYYAEDLKERISRILGQYAERSHLLDKSFPRQLFAAYEGENFHASNQSPQLEQRLGAIEKKREQLQNNGLLEEGSETSFGPLKSFSMRDLGQLDEAQRKAMILAMTLYTEASEQKLAVFDDLARKIEFFLANINHKFRHKRLRIKRDVGFEAVDENERTLSLDDLSSGEQHEIVLLYELLFFVQPNTLVLMDEPELSLHVSWQRDFLPDLLKIVELSNFDALIATHSPFIAEDRTDLMIPLSAA